MFFFIGAINQQKSYFNYSLILISHKFDALFQQGTRDIISVGYADADYWFQFPLLVNLSKSSQWHITINGYATDTMNFAKTSLFI